MISDQVVVLVESGESETLKFTETTVKRRKAARRQGRTGGRKRKMDDSKIAVAKRLLQDGIAPREVARSLEISIPTLYRWLPASQRL